MHLWRLGFAVAVNCPNGTGESLPRALRRKMNPGKPMSSSVRRDGEKVRIIIERVAPSASDEDRDAPFGMRPLGDWQCGA